MGHSNAQLIIRRYVASRFVLDAVRLYDEGQDYVRIVDESGDSMLLTCNIYGDIIEKLPDGQNKIIAESNLEHNLLCLGYRLPTKWRDHERV